MPDPQYFARRRGRAAARAALSAVARTISDFAAALVPTAGDELATPEDWANSARRMSMLALEYRLRSLAMVMQDLERQGFDDDAAWIRAATAFGYASRVAWFRDEFEDAYRSWVNGEPRSWHPEWIRAHLGMNFDGDPDELARELDEWYQNAHPFDAEGDDLERSVRGGGVQMGPVSGNLRLGGAAPA
jgi:hypothetical protein